MIFSIIILIMIGMIAFFHYVQGVMSATISAILAVFAAALLPSLVIGGLIAGLSLGQEVATAALAAA